ncbi:MAG: beta-ketoacyl synthase N-terminal-like domain-containing protein, partial [Planctomycetota bacterium]
GEIGELIIGGVGVGMGYVNRDQLNRERFLLPRDQAERRYRSGDLVSLDVDGILWHRGRSDDQIKIGGYRIELGEIRAALQRLPRIQEVVVLPRQRASGPSIVAYVIETTDAESSSNDRSTGKEQTAAQNHSAAWRRMLADVLPGYMIPAAIIPVASFPMTAGDKLDVAALPMPASDRPALPAPPVLPRTTDEKRLAQIWIDILEVEPIGVEDSFFDLGGTSLAAAQMVAAANQAGFPIRVTDVFSNRTIRELLRRCGQQEASDPTGVPTSSTRNRPGCADHGYPKDAIAIIGMAARMPGADDVETFWKNLVAGRQTLRRFQAHELDPGVSQNDRIDPRYVPVRGILKDAEHFDASFFGVLPNSAALMDPQHRVLIQLAWHAMEDAG